MAGATVAQIPRKSALVALAGLMVVFGALAAGCSSSPTSSVVDVSSGSAPPLGVSGTAQGWTFHDGQSVNISMGPNKFFLPYLRLIILQCSDPAGKVANLPTSAGVNCDVDTVQSGSLIPNPSGSFSWTGYTIYRLPSKALDEGPTSLPQCDATHYCVLYVGDNYNDFSKPKVFSHPFLVLPSTSTGGSS
jgi:hypothetical protein